MFRDIKNRIIGVIEKEFNFSKYTIRSKDSFGDIEVYIREDKEFILCVSFVNLNSYININRYIHNFLTSKGIKYSLINIFIVSNLSEIESTYFQTEVYEEAIFIERSTGEIKSFNVHSLGLLNVLESVVKRDKKGKERYKNNYITVFLVLFTILVYFVIGAINGNLIYIRDEVLVWAGAKMDILIRSGEYNRIFMASFLHKNFVQLIVGVITLFFTGSIIEKNITKLGYVILVVLGMFVGNSTSYLFNFSNVFGVGLYVINYATMGALFILAFKYKNKVNRLFFIFMFSFIGINILNSMFLNNIDNFGSLASFVFGIVFMRVMDLLKG